MKSLRSLVLEPEGQRGEQCWFGSLRQSASQPLHPFPDRLDGRRARQNDRSEALHEGFVVVGLQHEEDVVARRIAPCTLRRPRQPRCGTALQRAIGDTPTVTTPRADHP